MNVISNIPLFIKVILPILAVITIWLLSGESNETKMRPFKKLDQASDYAMSNFTLTIMSASGEPARVISGKEMSHYPKDDSTKIDFPVAQFLDAEEDPWVVSSINGETLGKGEEILLTGNVILTRENNKSSELHTEELTLDTIRSTAYTELPVTFKSPHGETNAVGFHGALEDKMLNLHSRVKGTYDAPPQ